MSLQRIAILYGGRSSEHEVSLVSGAAVLRELAADGGYELLPIGIDPDGRWYVQEVARQLERARSGSPLEVMARVSELVTIVPGGGLAYADGRQLACDCVFPVLHGSFGEDGTVQGALELAGVPYVGSGVAGSAIGMDKLRAKQLWREGGLPVVPFHYARAEERASPGQRRRVASHALEQLGSPVFVKPNAASSSVGITKAASVDEVATAIEEALRFDTTVLIERAIAAREIETAVLGNEDPTAFPPGEVVPTHDFYDYEAKYVDPNGARLLIPAPLDAAVAERVRDISVAAFLACDCSGMARVDCFLDKTDGSVYLNEINTIPGFTPISMYPKMAEAAGVSYAALLSQLIELAVERAKRRGGLVTRFR